MAKVYLAITGVSGVGKDYIQDALIKHSEGRVAKLNQITTRRLRENDPKDKDSYLLFTNKEFYNKLNSKNLLIARTNVDGNLYGTLDDSMDDDRIYTVIVNSTGLEDLLYNKASLNGNVIVLNIQGDTHDNRGRDIENELKNIDYILDQARSYYTTPVIDFENVDDDTKDMSILDPFMRVRVDSAKENKAKTILSKIDKLME